MKAIHVNLLKDGDILSKPITDSYGRVLLQKNIELTDRLINRIKDFDLKYVYIEDDRSEGINEQGIISEELRMKTVNQIRSTFETFKAYNEGRQARYMLDQSILSIEDSAKEIASVIKNNEDMLTIMSNIFIFDDYLYNHSLNVAVYTLVLARELGFSESMMAEIGIGALLHDIGKMKIPKELLNKKGKLTDLEFEVIKEHTTYGYQMLKRETCLSSAILNCVYQHHERLDGSGYPNKLKGDEIHHYAKIIAVADVFDAVTSDRSYRAAYPPQEGLEILYSGSEKMFKREYIELFRKHISIYPNGISVELNDGRIGLVCKQNKYLSDRPVVRIIKENHKPLMVHEVYEVDLAKELSVTIKRLNHARI